MFSKFFSYKIRSSTWHFDLLFLLYISDRGNETLSCEIENGGCQQRCFIMSENMQLCACDTGFTHDPNDKKSCLGIYAY